MMTPDDAPIPLTNEAGELLTRSELSTSLAEYTAALPTVGERSKAADKLWLGKPFAAGGVVPEAGLAPVSRCSVYGSTRMPPPHDDLKPDVVDSDAHHGGLDKLAVNPGAFDRYARTRRMFLARRGGEEYP